MIPLIAIALLLPAAFAVQRHSALLARALWLAFDVALVYLALSKAYPLRWADGDFEALRWVSAATGLAGAWEIRTRWLYRTYRRRVPNNPNTRELLKFRRWTRDPRTDILAALFLGSMAADGAAALLERAGHPWGPMPVFQVAGLALVIFVSLWPSKWPRAKGWW